LSRIAVASHLSLTIPFLTSVDDSSMGEAKISGYALFAKHLRQKHYEIMKERMTMAEVCLLSDCYWINMTEIQKQAWKDKAKALRDEERKLRNGNNGDPPHLTLESTPLD